MEALHTHHSASAWGIGMAFIEVSGTLPTPGMGRYTAIGLGGQLIVIDPASSTVVVTFSSHSDPDSDQPEVEYAGAAAIVDALSVERRLHLLDCDGTRDRNPSVSDISRELVRRSMKCAGRATWIIVKRPSHLRLESFRLHRPSPVWPIGCLQKNMATTGQAKISATFPYKKQRRRVLGREMAYVEVGEGDPILLLHGNPTSSYLWRNVLPHLQPQGRCIAPDLMGMGDSDKLPDSGPGSYRFVDQRRYLDALLQALDVREQVTLVVHDWGSALGFDWANRHREAVKGIAYMEAIVRPQGWDHWDVMNMRPFLQALRSEAGEKMVLEENFFIEKILPGAILRTLTAEEMSEYRRPFAEPGEGRRPTLTWPREIPIEGEPADVNAIVSAYAEWLATTDVPKLFIKAEPGALLGGGVNLETARSWPAQTEVTVAGIHFVQEDSPDEIGRAIAGWMGT